MLINKKKESIMYEYNSRWHPRKITKEEYDYIKIFIYQLLIRKN